jgi:ligand-binding SRPBCC domain-containing protein
MKLYILKRKQFIKKSRAEVFEFFSKPENLAVLTPPDLGFHIFTPSPILMRNGTLIDYTIKILGTNIRWTTLVTEYSAPDRFVDAQLRGPYSFWHHTHEFDESGGGTLMTDTVRYALPFGILGTLMHELFIRRKLVQIFDYRQKRVEEVFLSGEDGEEVSKSGQGPASVSHRGSPRSRKRRVSVRAGVTPRA